MIESRQGNGEASNVSEEPSVHWRAERLAVGASLPCSPPESLLTQPTGPAQGRPEKWG